MEAVTALNSELKRHDTHSNGKIDFQTFKSILLHYGLNENQCENLASKFQCYGDPNSNGKSVDYMQFMQSFQERFQNRQKLNLSQQFSPFKFHSSPSSNSSNSSATQRKNPNQSNHKSSNLNTADFNNIESKHENKVPNSDVGSFQQMQVGSSLNTSRMMTNEYDFSNDSGENTVLGTSTCTRKTKPTKSNDSKQIIEVRQLSKLFDKLFQLDPQFTGRVPKQEFLNCLGEVSTSSESIIKDLFSQENDHDDTVDYNVIIKKLIVNDSKVTNININSEKEEESVPVQTTMQNEVAKLESTSPTHSIVMVTPTIDKKKDELLEVNTQSGVKATTSSQQNLKTNEKEEKKLRQLKEFVSFQCQIKGRSIRNVFRTLDTENSGQVTYEQFRDGLLNVYRIPVHESWLQKLFSRSNTKENGLLSFEEFKNTLTMKAKECGDVTNESKLNNPFAESIQKANQACKDGREKNFEDSDIFNFDPFKQERASQIKTNSLAHYTSSNHPLLTEFPGSNIKYRKHYDLLRIQKFISEKAQIKSINLKDLFLFMDTNSDGRLSYDEFRSGLQAIGVPPLSDRQFDEVIKATDCDNDGFIVYEELCRFINNDATMLTSNLSPLENSTRRRKFITPNLSKEAYQEVSRKRSTQRSKPLLPNNERIFLKIAKQLHGNKYENFRENLKRVDINHKGVVPREVLKLALRESGVIIGNHQFELLFDQLDHRRNDAVPYHDFWKNVEAAQETLQQRISERVPGFEDISLSSKQKKKLSHCLSLFSHTKRLLKDDIGELNRTEHLIGRNALESALKSLGITLSPQQLSILVEKATVPSDSQKGLPKLDSRIVFKLLAGQDHPSQSSSNFSSNISNEIVSTESDNETKKGDNRSKILVGIVRKIKDKFLTKNFNLHDAFVSLPKSMGGVITAKELKDGIINLGVDITPQELDDFFQHCHIDQNDNISFQRFSSILKASNQSFVLDKSNEFVNEILKERIKSESISQFVGKSGIMSESKFKETLHSLFPKISHWMVDLAVRVSRVRNNGKCDLQKLVNYLDNTNQSSQDFEGYSLIETNLTEKETSYNPRGRGLQKVDSITFSEFVSPNIQENIKSFSKKMHLDRYASPPLTRYYGQPEPISPNFVKKEIRSKKKTFPCKYNKSDIFNATSATLQHYNGRRAMSLYNTNRPQSAPRLLGRKRLDSVIFRSTFNPISF